MCHFTRHCAISHGFFVFFLTWHTSLVDGTCGFALGAGWKQKQNHYLGMPFETVLACWCVISLAAYCLACHFAVPVRSPLSLKSCGGSHIYSRMFFFRDAAALLRESYRLVQRNSYVSCSYLIELMFLERDLFLVFMWRNHIPKLNITLPSDVLISSDKRPYSYLTFHIVLARQGSSNCTRPRLNFQPFALRDMTMTARECCRVCQKMTYRFSFC